MKKKPVDFNTYSRKEQFKFFELNDDPIWGLTVEIDCTKAYKTAKKNKFSFFQYFLHKALKACINTKEFRYRVENGQIFDYDTLVASATIAKDDGTFGFSYIDFYEDFREFSHFASLEIEKVKNESKLIPTINNENVIHFSSVPWVNFTTVTIPKINPKNDFIPKIIFGKAVFKDEVMKMPLAVFVNHILLDAIHVSNFINSFQKYMNE